MKHKMPKASLFLPVVLMALLMSCSHLPLTKTLKPATDQRQVETCESPYVKTPYRFVHAIEATLPGDRSATMIGVTVVDPNCQALHSVLMTLEGLVLFDGESDRENLYVSRAVPPFDKESFARNMMDDVRLLFLAPADPTLETGILKNGETLCRFKGNAGETIDVLIRQDRTWKIETYAMPTKRLREVNAVDLTEGIPGDIELQGHANGNYTLRLKLIHAEPLSGESSAKEPGEEIDNE